MKSKTIGLKLTDAEITMVNQLKRDGLTNSDVLRNALHQYYKYEVNQVNHTQQIDKYKQVNQKVNQEVNQVNQYDELNQSIKHLDGKINDIMIQLKGTKKSYNNSIIRGLI